MGLEIVRISVRVVEIFSLSSGFILQRSPNSLPWSQNGHILGDREGSKGVMRDPKGLKFRYSFLTLSGLAVHSGCRYWMV
jgi:hypothetical protein